MSYKNIPVKTVYGVEVPKHQLKGRVTTDEVLSAYGADNVFWTVRKDPLVDVLRNKYGDSRFFNKGINGVNYEVYDVFTDEGVPVAVVVGDSVPSVLTRNPVSANPDFHTDCFVYKPADKWGYSPLYRK